MSKMLKAIVMLLVVAAVVFAAGCAEKTAPAENVTTAAPEHTAPAETPAMTNITENVTENVSETTGPSIVQATVNETENETAAPTSVVKSSTQRKIELARARANLTTASQENVTGNNTE